MRINYKSDIGDIVCAFGYARREQIVDARDQKCLEEILVSQGVCTKEQVDFALEVQWHMRLANQMNKVEVSLAAGHGSTGGIMFVLGFIEREHFYAVVDWQAEEMRDGRDPPASQDLLLQHGCCTQEQVDFAVKVQLELNRKD